MIAWTPQAYLEIRVSQTKILYPVIFSVSKYGGYGARVELEFWKRSMPYILSALSGFLYSLSESYQDCWGFHVVRMNL